MARSNIFGTDRPLHEFTRSTERPCSSNNVRKILGEEWGEDAKNVCNQLWALGRSIPVGAMDGNRTGVRFPFLRIPPNATRPLMSLPHIRMTRGLPADISSTEGSIRKPFGVTR